MRLESALSRCIAKPIRFQTDETARLAMEALGTRKGQYFWIEQTGTDLIVRNEFNQECKGAVVNEFVKNYREAAK